MTIELQLKRLTRVRNNLLRAITHLDHAVEAMEKDPPDAATSLDQVGEELATATRTMGLVGEAFDAEEV